MQHEDRPSILALLGFDAARVVSAGWEPSIVVSPGASVTDVLETMRVARSEQTAVARAAHCRVGIYL